MIYDTIKNIDNYKGISTQLDFGLELLRTMDFLSLKPGTYRVDDKVYYNVMEPEVHDWENTSWECHRKYLDIQYTLTEGEQIGVTSLEAVNEWSPYDEDDDCCISKFQAPCVSLPMNKDMFAVFFPGDAHRPAWALGMDRKVKKVVLKILWAE